MSNKHPISAIIPTLNEEHNIRKAIECVSFADEIIVIDSHSTDNTVKIAEELNATVILRKFDNYSSQKNHAIDVAQNDWVLILDADERILPPLRLEIEEAVNQTKNIAFWAFRRNYFLGKEVNFSGWQNDKVIRLFNKNNGRYEGNVHEEIVFDGNASFFKNKLEHYSFVSLQHYIGKQQKYALMQAEVLHSKGKRATLLHLVGKPFFRFFKHYFLQLGILDGLTGLIIASISAQYVFYRYTKLWELQNIKNKK